MRRGIGMLLVLTFLNAACFETDVQKAENALQSAIDQLANAPGNLKAVLDGTIQQLNQLQGDTIRNAQNAVENVLGDAAGLANATAQCQMDSIGIRADDTLKYILHHDLMGQSPPLPTSWVCITNPTTIGVMQTSQGGPYTLNSNPLYQIFGFNFRDQGLPTINYYRNSGQLFAGSVVQAGLHTPYEIDLNLQTVSFAGAQTGDYFKSEWNNGTTGTNRVDIILTPFTAPPPPPHRIEHFVVSVHANSGAFNGECKNIGDDALSLFTIGSPWKIDRAQGDPNHDGVHEESNADNHQADATLRGYNYQALNDQQVKVVGTICGAGGWGPGAIFDRGYAVYETQ